MKILDHLTLSECANCGHRHIIIATTPAKCWLCPCRTFVNPDSHSSSKEKES